MWISSGTGFCHRPTAPIFSKKAEAKLHIQMFKVVKILKIYSLYQHSCQIYKSYVSTGRYGVEYRSFACKKLIERYCNKFILQQQLLPRILFIFSELFSVIPAVDIVTIGQCVFLVKSTQNYLSTLSFSSVLAQFSVTRLPLYPSGDSASKPTRSAGCRKGKHKRKKLLMWSDSKGTKDDFCPHLVGETQDGQPWCPSSTSSPYASGPLLQAAVVVPSQAPCLVQALPLPTMTSLGREHAASETALQSLPEPPFPNGLQSFPALPSACLDTFMNIFLHDPPICPLLLPPFSPYPFLGAAGSSQIPASVSAVPPNPGPPSSAISQRSGEGKWGTQNEGHPLINSKSSSPLQLDLLQEDRPRSCASPEAEYVSDTNFQHTREKINVRPLIKIKVFVLRLKTNGLDG